jgi:hypothetical protein
MADERLFTLDEATRLLPRLRTLMIEASEEWRRMRDLNPEIQRVRDRVPLDGFSASGVPYIEAVSHLMYLLQQVKEMGVHVKDIDKGLCDFPYMRKGKMVYLCWHLGEDAITSWHDIEAGFAGREPLDETDR